MDIFVADESVDFRIIQALRDKGFFVISVLEENPGWTDTDVLDYCITNKYILITEDKDFGELCIRFKKLNYGVVLLRLFGLDFRDKVETVVASFIQNHTEFINSYSVLSLRKLRIRKY